MKAITLWQPWASAITLGVKTIETRSWATSYRGPLAIHAAARKPTVDEQDLVEVLVNMRRGHPLPLGAVVATCDLVHVARADAIVKTEQEERWGNFSEGRFAWILQNVRPLDPPVAARGYQQIWNWSRA